MKGPQLKRLVEQYLLPHLPGFAYARRVLYRRPVAPLLRGVCLASSGFTSEGFYMDVFVMPLHTEPQDCIVLSHGKRLDPEWIDVIPGDEADGMAAALRVILREALPYLDARDSVSSFLATERRRIARCRNPLELLDFASSFVFVGDVPQARSLLERMIRLVGEDADPRDHDCQSRERGKELIGALDRDLCTARKVLEQWSQRTMSALKLE